MSPPSRTLVTAVTAKVPWAATADWQPLTGGRTNFAWKLTANECGDALVVKLYRGEARNPLFPNDPNSEAVLLRKMAATGLAPKLVASFRTDVGACNIYTHIPGETWQKDTSIVGKRMRSLHGVEVPDNLRVATNGSHKLAKKTESILAKCRKNASLLSLRPQGNIAPLRRCVLLHGDIVPGNLILNETGLHLIDWQCPSMGDPCEDIAIFLSPAMQALYRGDALTDGEKNSFFQAYSDIEIQQRYEALAPWYHWRMAAYCQWQSENGRPDYAAARDLEVQELQRSRSQ